MNPFLAAIGKRVLVLDNHDDFGGHAKRNEFTHDGRMLMLNGGTGLNYLDSLIDWGTALGTAGTFNTNLNSATVVMAVMATAATTVAAVATATTTTIAVTVAVVATTTTTTTTM